MIIEIIKINKRNGTSANIISYIFTYAGMSDSIEALSISTQYKTISLTSFMS